MQDTMRRGLTRHEEYKGVRRIERSQVELHIDCMHVDDYANPAVNGGAHTGSGRSFHKPRFPSITVSFHHQHLDET